MVNSKFSKGDKKENALLEIYPVNSNTEMWLTLKNSAHISLVTYVSVGILMKSKIMSLLRRESGRITAAHL